MALYPLVRPLAFALDAEKAHRMTIAALKLGIGTAFTPQPRDIPELRIKVAGIDFPNPIGLAAGFDKDAEVFEQMLTLKFGFVEVGTLTHKPQEGNPKPRLFRLVEDRAVINRMGFNNQGQDAALGRLKRRHKTRGIVGVNIGANKDSADRIADYADGIRRMAPVADYLTVNISSPNTPGLRQLQDEGALRALLSAVEEARSDDGPPVFLKVAPDLGAGEPDQIVRAALDHGIDAIIVANTTVSRPTLGSAHAGESGGLSGAPLKALALEALRTFRAASGGKVTLIAAGGVSTADDAWERITAGASLVQLYSAMVYEGPGIARRIVQGLKERVKREGLKSIEEAVGSAR
ncbi:quinone-dependent dihydroorotate dehydrogenase [Sphingomonas piscis]|uniref:Dihydroorotate dehydrogenase (quinone) n=1 Tax=Sphingomonas piscis TaxID=2714943 RepID=A0A6G7YP66_9SPHN|nr:quinone-dependent dihydroorotate dehydrogenase [Sphingomonas piscis]QIK78538.1 quinone-dependent dihydroorotate dehydrogenase [Sphingomonas piscis]